MGEVSCSASARWRAVVGQYYPASMKAFQLAAPIVPGLAIGKPSPIPLTRFDAAQKAARNGVIGDSARHRIKSASIEVNVTPLRVASV